MPLNNPITPALLADPEIFQQNRLPFHAHFADQTSPEMPLTVSLDGAWSFRYAENLTAPFSEWDMPGGGSNDFSHCRISDTPCRIIDNTFESLFIIGIHYQTEVKIGRASCRERV